MFDGAIPAVMYSYIYMFFIAVLTLYYAVLLYPMGSKDLYEKNK